MLLLSAHNVCCRKVVYLVALVVTTAGIARCKAVTVAGTFGATDVMSAMTHVVAAAHLTWNLIISVTGALLKTHTERPNAFVVATSM